MSFIRQLIAEQVTQLEQNGRFEMEKEAFQHGTVTVYEHSLRVAECSCKIAEKLGWKIDMESLVRGALLHDYFLYDWHEGSSGHRLHGFSHPVTALSNAMEDYELNFVERDIIRKHMFPMTLVPPVTREALIVCIADKICATQETLMMRRLVGASE